MAKMVPKIVKRAGTLNRHLRVAKILSDVLHIHVSINVTHRSLLRVPARLTVSETILAIF